MSENRKTGKQPGRELENLRRRIADLEKSETDRQQAEEALDETRKTFQALINATQETLIMIDVAGTVLLANETVARRLGISLQELIGSCVYDHLPPDVARLRKEQFDKVSHTGESVHFQDVREGRFFDTYGYPVFDREEKVSKIAIFSHDVTERQQAERKLLESEERYRTAIEHSNDGVAFVQEGQHVYVNQKFLKIFGYNTTEEVIGKTHSLTVHPDDLEKVIEINRQREKGGPFPLRYEFKGIRKDGTLIYMESSSTRVTIQGESFSLVFLREITERKMLEEKLRAISITDELTGLYNRRGFLTLSQQQLQVAERTKGNLLYLYADLDRMKWVNDTLGHQAGDRALIETANILKETFRKSDIVGRMGGDEFAVLAISSAEDTPEIVVARLREKIKRINEFGTRDYTISLSLGIVPYNPQKPSTLDELIDQGDQLMYEEKKNKQQK
jgi:diguanylate cyclase (GGDEF)-like protein/PAS domain S-box-containing protein